MFKFYILPLFCKYLSFNSFLKVFVIFEGALTMAALGVLLIMITINVLSYVFNGMVLSCSTNSLYYRLSDCTDWLRIHHSALPAGNAHK